MVAPWLRDRPIAPRRERCHAREEQDSVRGPRPCVAPAILSGVRERVFYLGAISVHLASFRPFVRHERKAYTRAAPLFRVRD